MQLYYVHKVLFCYRPLCSDGWMAPLIRTAIGWSLVVWLGGSGPISCAASPTLLDPRVDPSTIDTFMRMPGSSSELFHLGEAEPAGHPESPEAEERMIIVTASHASVSAIEIADVINTAFWSVRPMPDGSPPPQDTMYEATRITVDEVEGVLERSRDANAREDIIVALRPETAATSQKVCIIIADDHDGH